jgi:hypothetical protein
MRKRPDQHPGLKRGITQKQAGRGGDHLRVDRRAVPAEGIEIRDLAFHVKNYGGWGRNPKTGRSSR